MDLSKSPKQKSGYYMETLDDEVLLYHPDKTKILYCNQTASWIWQLCNGVYTITAITELLSQAYPEAATTITADVQTTLQQFLDYGAIELM